jgi:hypothetical protein
MKLPWEIFTTEKREQLAMQSLHEQIPRVELDQIELEQDFATGGYFLRCRKGDRLLNMRVESFPELKPEELATIVLFAG